MRYYIITILYMKDIVIAINRDGYKYLKRLSEIYFIIRQEDFIIWNTNKSSYPRLMKTNRRGKSGFEEIKLYLGDLTGIDNKLIIQLCKLYDSDTYNKAFESVTEEYPVLSPSPFVKINNKDLSVHDWTTSNVEREAMINKTILDFFIKSQSPTTLNDNMNNIKSMLNFYFWNDINKLELINYITTLN